MLGKLIRHELKATWRYFVPIYGALLLLGALTRFSIFLGDQIRSELADVPIFVFTSSYVLLLIAALFAVFFLMLQRFYKQLLGDSGYLMFTLPVYPWQLILSRLTASIVWLYATLAVIFSSLLLLFVGLLDFNLAELAQNIVSGAQELFEEVLEPSVLFHGAIWITEYLLALFISSAASYLLYYMCIAIGHQFRNHRLLASIGVYFGLEMVMQTVTGFLVFPGILLLENLNWTALNPILLIHVIMAIALLYAVFMAAAGFFVTERLLSRRLNLN